MADKKEIKEEKREVVIPEENGLINCLSNKKVIVRYLTKPTNLVKNPKHILYGGLAEGAKREFVVPILQSNGAYYNVLTNDEKRYLEYIMGMEHNTLSIYKKVDNFWDTFKVTLTKEDTYLDLSDPMDYIKYKVLLANDLYVAKSLAALEDRPKATYQFVMIMENEEDTRNMKKLNYSMEAYMLLGRYMEDRDVLSTLLESMDGRPVSKSIKTEVLLSRLQQLITSNAKLFVKFANDPLLSVKVLIRKCLAERLIVKRGDYYYLASDNSPLCNENAEPTLNVAAAFLADPKRSDLKFTLEGKLKE